VKRVLVVCTGNICRSAMAEVVLNSEAERRGLRIEADSAGISDEEEGNPIDPRARRVLEEGGYTVSSHRAHQVRPGELATYDLVLAMTSYHQAALRRQAAREGVDPDRIRLWREFDPDGRGGHDLDVPDPWYGSYRDFKDTLKVVEQCAPHILEALAEE